MAAVHTAELDAFVAFVDNECGGNLRDARVVQRYSPFEYVHETVVDQTVSPFSPAYFESQLTLYREIAGRPLDQWTGELHPVDVTSLLDTANPQGIVDVAHVAENVRAVSAMLSLLGLPPEANLLDMGAGHGMSSEVYAFCGARVHSIDIDPGLSRLAEQRAARRSLNVRRSVLNYDALGAIPNRNYDAALFFQSLHHALRPWELVRELKTKLVEDSVIAFCGEPIQDAPWKHWGLRLDIESIYVARKFGWFESGWSRDFIAEAFRSAGFYVTFFGGGHQGGLIGVASTMQTRQQSIIKRAAQLGHSAYEERAVRPDRDSFYSQIGVFAETSSLGPFIRTLTRHPGGFLCFGPYTPLAAGRYELCMLIVKPADARTAGTAGTITIDVISDAGATSHCAETIRLRPGEYSRGIRIEFSLVSDVLKIETRAFVAEADAAWEISLPAIRPLPHDISEHRH